MLGTNPLYTVHLDNMHGIYEMSSTNDDNENNRNAHGQKIPAWRHRLEILWIDIVIAGAHETTVIANSGTNSAEELMFSSCTNSLCPDFDSLKTKFPLFFGAYLQVSIYEYVVHGTRYFDEQSPYSNDKPPHKHLAASESNKDILQALAPQGYFSQKK